MFNLFSKKPKPRQLKHIAYISKVAKYKNVLQQFKADADQQHVLIVYFFDQTKAEILQLSKALNIQISEDLGVISSPGYVLLSGHALSGLGYIKADKVILIEAHPMLSVQREVVEHFDKSVETICYIGLDEAVIDIFGGDRVRNMMQKMAVSEDEAIAHQMIDTAITKAQEKLQKELVNHQDIRTSQDAWRKANGK